MAVIFLLTLQILLVLQIQPCFSTLHRNRTINAHLISWINNPPYYIKDGSPGLVSTILEYQLPGYVNERSTSEEKEIISFNIIENLNKSLNNESELVSLISESNKTRLYTRLDTTPESHDVYVVASTAMIMKLENRFFQRLPICQTDKVVLVVRKKDILLIRQLVNGIVDSSAIIFFAVVIAVNLAAVIWFIEHYSNIDFENNFGTGLWTSVWYCFVTLTTVGYGDKVPKHFASRFLSLVWMIFGLVLTALITANVLQAMQNGFSSDGKDIGLVTGQVDQQMIVGQLNANPVTYDYVDKAIQALRTNEIDGAVIDGFTVGYLLRDTKEFGDLKMSAMFSIRKNVYIYVFHNKLKSGLQFNPKVSKHFQDRTHAVIRRFVPPYTITKYYVRSIAELFDVKQDGGLVLGFTLSGLCFIMAAISSQFLSRIVLEKAGKFTKSER